MTPIDRCAVAAIAINANSVHKRMPNDPVAITLSASRRRLRITSASLEDLQWKCRLKNVPQMVCDASPS